MRLKEWKKWVDLAAYININYVNLCSCYCSIEYYYKLILTSFLGTVGLEKIKSGEGILINLVEHIQRQTFNVKMWAILLQLVNSMCKHE